MRFYQRGQAMAEYLVVAGALMTAFFWAANADCPGYYSCVDQLKTVMHDKYEGYSHSISAVHKYDDVEGAGFEAWEDGSSSTEGEGGSGSFGDTSAEVDLERTPMVVGEGGDTNYGTLVDGDKVVDADGNQIGTFDGTTITLNDGSTYDGFVTQVVTDQDGNPAPLKAIVYCGISSITKDVRGFAYESGATGDYYYSLGLKPVEKEVPSPLYCTENTYGVIDEDGETIEGFVVVYNKAFAPISQNLDGVPAQGDLVRFIMEDEDGNDVDVCVVLGRGWNLDEDGDETDDEDDLLANYLTGDFTLGFLDEDGTGTNCLIQGAQLVTD